MGKKKNIRKNKNNLKSLSFSDLYAMYMFIGSHNNSVFGKRSKSKEMFKSKLIEIEEEIFSRIFGKNPFKAEDGVSNKDVVDIKGIDPVKVISSFPIQDEKRFIITKNERDK